MVRSAGASTRGGGHRDGQGGHSLFPSPYLAMLVSQAERVQPDCSAFARSSALETVLQGDLLNMNKVSPSNLVCFDRLLFTRNYQ